MELRTRILPKMTNREVEEYLKNNDIIIVPVGTVEMHGGLPLDAETVTGEAIGLKIAEAADGLVLTGLPYFYAGATASGRGTVQVSIRQGMDYLRGIAHSLLRQGFKRQIYISFHGPAHMTCSPMVRDFFDETGVPILYMDLAMQSIEDMSANQSDFLKNLDAMMIGAYDIMGRLSDVPLTTEYYHTEAQTVAPYNDLFQLAYQSGSIGYYYGDSKDHLPTTPIPDEAARYELARQGKILIEKMVETVNMPEVLEKMYSLRIFEGEISQKCPWVPFIYKQSIR